MTHICIGVDPGKHHAGIAVFADFELVAVTCVEATSPLEVIREADRWIFANRPRGIPDLLVVENQQVYPGRGKGNPNDLIPLSFVAGGIAAMVNATDTMTPLPNKWKGNTPKAIFTQRLLSRMTARDRDILANAQIKGRLLHNAVDACGLALYGLGALTKPVAEDKGDA